MEAPLTIWCNAELGEAAKSELIEGTSGHRLIFSSIPTWNLSTGAPDASLGEASIAFGQPDPGQCIASEGLKWVQITSAGYTRYDTDEFRNAMVRRGGSFTNSSSVFDDPCAQHLLAFMLAEARQLSASQKAQESGTWNFAGLRPLTRVLSGQTVLLLGYGAIARRFVELAQPFHLTMIGFRRRPTGDEEIPVYPMSDLDRWLPQADYVLNILPASPSTDQIVDAEMIDKMRPGAVFANVGRGTTVNQEALIAALGSGHLAAAYLDVTDPEPLPVEHPLWGAPNCFITPHIAGGHAGEDIRLVSHFLTNLRRYEAGDPLLDRLV